MGSDTLLKTLVVLEAEKAKIEEAIACIRRILDQDNTPTSTIPFIEKKRNKPGELKEMIIQVLQEAGKPLSVANIRDAAIEKGCVYRDKRTIYSAVFNVLNRESVFKRTDDGYVLK